MPKTTSKPSQEFVPVKEIRDGIIILKDGSMRLVLMSSSLNFALKSQEEQMAIISQYQNLLNALDFSAQIFIQSRPININPYLDALKEAEKNQSNELLQLQIREYIEFVKILVKTANIVSKNFYVIVSFNPSFLETGKGKNILSKISGVFG